MRKAIQSDLAAPERELFRQAVLGYMVNNERVRCRSKYRAGRHTARRVLTAAACLLAAAAITTFAIPSARAAVEEWFSGWFGASGYFGQESEDRAKEPTIEAIITDAGENNVTVSDVGEGYETYAATFQMSLDEIAYDGSSIFVSGTMSGETARPFVEAMTGGDTFRCAKYDGSLGGGADLEYYYFACENNVKFTTADGRSYIGELVPSFTPEMDEICTALANETSESVFENGELVTSNPKADELWDAYLSDHDVRFSMELQPTQTDTSLSGKAVGELTLRMRYDNVDSEDPVPVLNASFGLITIDADAYLAQSKTTLAQPGASVNLGGIHPVTICEWQPEEERTSDDCEVYYYTNELDFTGASVALKEIAFTPTDTVITLHIVLPESWTVAERSCGVAFHFLLDGEKVNGSIDTPFDACGPNGDTEDWREFDYTFSESTLSPSQWAAAKTLTIIPTSIYWWDIKSNCDDGSFETVSLRDGAVYTAIVNHSVYGYDEMYDEMTQYAITVQLDDYR